MDDKHPDQQASLIDIIEFRDATYESITETALLPYREKLSEAVSFFMKITAPIRWTSIEKVRGLDGFVTIMGFVLPELGAKMKVGEDIVEVNPDNVDKFRSMVRFIVPAKLMEEGSRLQIANFIRDLSAIAAVTPELELQTMLREYQFDGMESLTSHENYNKMLDIATRPTDIAGFDGRNLTDDQIRAAFLFSSAVSETRN